jgi:muramoyltetrapeptide carboxypeptidase
VASYSRPPALRPGDAIAVIAPAGLPDPQLLARGLALLGERYDVRLRRALPGEPWGTLAGPDDVRADELCWALGDPEVRAVIAARGGYGTTRILGLGPLEVLARSPRVVIGFSDLTALLGGVLGRAGLAAIHGPMVCQIGEQGPAALGALVAIMESAVPRPAVEGLVTVVPGVARGPLVGGNLTMLAHMVGTVLLPSMAGAVLFIEEVGERPYRIDRCLTHLEMSRALDGIAGAVVGQLTDCRAEQGELSAETVVEERLGRLGVPVARGLAAGHGWPNTPLPLGVTVELDSSAGRLRFLEAAVSLRP